MYEDKVKVVFYFLRVVTSTISIVFQASDYNIQEWDACEKAPKDWI